MVIGPMFFYKVEERVFYRLVALMLMGKLVLVSTGLLDDLESRCYLYVLSYTLFKEILPPYRFRQGVESPQERSKLEIVVCESIIS